MIKKIFFLILSMPKTIYFNFKAFKIKEAIKLPVIISYKTKMGKIYKNRIKIDGSRKKIIFGWGGSNHIISNRYSYITIGKDARITFKGNACFGEGNSLRCDEGELIFGKNFSTNKNCNISCNYKMEFADNVLVGWNVIFRDSDGHKIFFNNEEKISKKEVIIGKNVWICSYANILKGAEIPEGCVVAWKSLVLKKFNIKNSIIGGSPAKVIQENICWEK